MEKKAKEWTEERAEPSQQRALLESMKNHCQGLTVFVDNPDVPLDNNTPERESKSAVLGRKNYWGNHSEQVALTQACEENRHRNYTCLPSFQIAEDVID